MTAYDDLNAFRFAPGKGYDRQSVETFRALALNHVDDLLNRVTSLRDDVARLQAGDQDEAAVLAGFRAMDPATRRSLLDQLRPTPSPVSVPTPPWLDERITPPGLDMSSPPPPAPVSLARLFDEPEPAPSTSGPIGLAGLFGSDPEPTPSPAGVSAAPIAVANPITVKAPPAPWLAEGPRAEATVLAFPSRDAEPTVVDSRLDDLFARLDFGPPAADLLAAASSLAEPEPFGQLAAVIALRAPIEVAVPSGVGELPVPTPAFGGWLR